MKDPHKPMPAAERLRAKKETVIRVWLERLREEVGPAREEGDPVLINTLPALLDKFAEALSPNDPRQSATEGTTLAEEHGGERVRLTRFRLEDLMAEYRVLRRVLVEVLEADEPLTAHERSTLHASIDEATSKAATAFLLVEQGLRERVFAVLAHDLRGPLATASLSLQLIAQAPTSSEVPVWVGRGKRAVDRVDRMVQDLLDAMRMQAGEHAKLPLEEADLVEIVRQAVDQLEGEHGARFVLESASPVRGWFARDALRRAVENLGNNAVKYGTPSEPVTIRMRTVHGRAIVDVHNVGSYIPVDEQETLFRAFHRRPTTEEGKRGWGLGLAQVRSAAEAHGGSITVDSLPDRGTTFTIDIPVDGRPFQDAPRTP